MLLACALITLVISFLFPFIIHESASGYLTLFWLWGIPSYNSTIFTVLMIPFMILSIGIIAEMMIVLYKLVASRNKKQKPELKSQNWIKRGTEIIFIEFVWTLWFYLVFLTWPFGFYFVQIPIFFPLIGGVMLIIAGSLIKPIEVQKEEVLRGKSILRLIYYLYYFVFSLYFIFFVMLFIIWVFPENEGLHYTILYTAYPFNLTFLTLLMIKFGKTLNNCTINTLYKQKQLNWLYIMTFTIIGILIFVYCISNTTFSLFFEIQD